jgi:hypothetical protein
MLKPIHLLTHILNPNKITSPYAQYPHLKPPRLIIQIQSNNPLILISLSLGPKLIILNLNKKLPHRLRWSFRPSLWNRWGARWRDGRAIGFSAGTLLRWLFCLRWSLARVKPAMRRSTSCRLRMRLITISLGFGRRTGSLTSASRLCSRSCPIGGRTSPCRSGWMWTSMAKWYVICPRFPYTSWKCCRLAFVNSGHFFKMIISISGVIIGVIMMIFRRRTSGHLIRSIFYLSSIIFPFIYVYYKGQCLL